MTQFTPCPTPFNLAAHALRWAAVQPEKVAFEILFPSSVKKLSFGELETAVLGMGGALLARGLVPGDRVLLRLGNSERFPIAFLGAIAAGLVPVPTAAGLTAVEITRMAVQIAPALIIADPGIVLPAHPAPVIEYCDLKGADPCDWDMGLPDRLAYIVFTSGTSGQSLAVAHAHRALWARGMMHVEWEGLTCSDRLLHAGALNWTFTLGTGLLDPWTVGATALIPAPGTTPADLPALAAKHHATIFAAAPSVYRQMLRLPLPALPQLRHGLCAGEALADTLRRKWAAITGTDLHEALGMTECSTFISGSPTRPAPIGTTGYAQSGRRIAVLDDNGEALPAGKPGILAIDRNDPGLMLGYLGAPNETAERLRGPWFLTGDLVEVDMQGALRHLGRADELMNPGGFRVAPQEVEAALSMLPGITDLAVAEVQLRPGVTVIACGYLGPETFPTDRLTAAAAPILARHKQPRLWLHLDHLPRNANMKLNRRALREELQSRLPKEIE